MMVLLKRTQLADNQTEKQHNKKNIWLKTKTQHNNKTTKRQQKHNTTRKNNTTTKTHLADNKNCDSNSFPVPLRWRVGHQVLGRNVWGFAYSFCLFGYQVVSGVEIPGLHVEAIALNRASFTAHAEQDYLFLDSFPCFPCWLCACAVNEKSKSLSYCCEWQMQAGDEQTSQNLKRLHFWQLGRALRTRNLQFRKPLAQITPSSLIFLLKKKLFVVRWGKVWK